MNEISVQKNFFNKILVNWLGLFAFLIPLVFCFYTYDSAQVKITFFYLASCGAFFIWLASLIGCSQSIFTKKNFYTLLPVLIYALYIFCSFIFKPYPFVRLESFTRELFCFALFLVVVFALREEDFKIILKYFFASAWIVFGYGLLQLVNWDFLPWKNFFSNRIFSTLANPNLLGSYALFTAALVFFSYLIKREKSLIILFVLALINLVFSQSKGALFAFALSVFLGTLFFAYFFLDKYKKHKNKVIALSLLLPLFIGGVIFYVGSKRVESFSFRLSTWRSSFDMLKDSALTGTGIGSFELIYPAYKRAEIFYIENNPSVMSQHVENFYLEQLTSLGILGFGLFVWVLYYILKQTLFKLKLLVKTNPKKAYLLCGFSFASLTVYIHSFVDVSIYFASTFFLLTLANGAIFNLSFGPFDKKDSDLKKENILIFKIVFALTILVLLTILCYIQKSFWTEFFLSYNNNLLQLFYCFGFLFITGLILFLFIYLMYKTRKTGVCFGMFFAALFYFIFWQQFISNVNFSRATALAEKGRFEALSYYTKAIKQNPTFYPAWHFRGLLLSNRLALIERVEVEAGDTNKPSNDFKRALRDFTKTKKLAPNAALLDYNIASLYLKYAATRQDLRERQKLYSQAEELFKRALLLDPVYENTYFQLANIELARANKQKALYWLQSYLQGPREVKNLAYLKTHRENKKAREVFENLGGKL